MSTDFFPYKYKTRAVLPAPSLDTVLEEHRQTMALTQQRNQRLQFKLERLQRAIREYYNGTIGMKSLIEALED